MIKSFYFEFSNHFKISNEYEAITKDLGPENYCILKHIRKEIKKQELKFEIDIISKLHNIGFETIFFNKVKAEMNEKLKICFKQIIENFDDYILEHKKKYKYKWTCKGFEAKTLYLKELGKLDIKIRKYIVKNNQGKNKVVYLVLYILNISDDLLIFDQK